MTRVYLPSGGVDADFHQTPEMKEFRAAVRKLFESVDADVRHLSHAMVWEVMTEEVRTYGTKRRSLPWKHC
jgi:hypothetical protein